MRFTRTNTWSSKDEESSLPLPLATGGYGGARVAMLMLCSLQTHESHLIQLHEVNAEASRRSSGQLCHLPGEGGLDSTPHFHRWTSGLSCIHQQGEKRVVFCLALHSGYPNLKWRCLLSFCFFLRLLALMHASSERTHPFQSCHFISATRASLCTNPLIPEKTSTTGVIGTGASAFDVMSSGFFALNMSI